MLKAILTILSICAIALCIAIEMIIKVIRKSVAIARKVPQKSVIVAQNDAQKSAKE